MSFANDLKNTINNENNAQKSMTTNGAIAYKTSGKALLDFNFKISHYRNADYAEIANDFAKVYYEDELLAIKYLFYISDIRGGLGERHTSRACFLWLHNYHRDIFKKIWCLIPEYNRWDTTIMFANPTYNKDEEDRQAYSSAIEKQLIEDLKNSLKGNLISLLAKWMPSENASSKESKAMARQFQSDWSLTPRTYRKILSSLRNYLNIVECDMSANRWQNIDYEKVPSKANLKYYNAFMAHDEERRKDYLDKVENDKAIIHSKVLTPHEIVHAYTKGYYHYLGINIAPERELELLWNNLPDYDLKNTLVIRDGSGSMTCGSCSDNICPLEVATALAIYASEHNNYYWADKFITFSSHPKFIDLSKCNSLASKIQLTYAEDDCSNTNIYKTMKLILETAVKNKYHQNELPSTILIISDMQFDGRSFNMDETLFETISKEYAEYGYKLPKIVFWNLDVESRGTIPLQQNEYGLILISGYSTTLFEMVMSNEIDPYKALVKVLNSERYDLIEEYLEE